MSGFDILLMVVASVLTGLVIGYKTREANDKLLPCHRSEDETAPDPLTLYGPEAIEEARAIWNSEDTPQNTKVVYLIERFGRKWAEVVAYIEATE